MNLTELHLLSAKKGLTIRLSNCSAVFPSATKTAVPVPSLNSMVRRSFGIAWTYFMHVGGTLFHIQDFSAALRAGNIKPLVGNMTCLCENRKAVVFLNVLIHLVVFISAIVTQCL